MGRKEIKWSLGTSNPREAARLIDFESAKADAIFDAKRREITGSGSKTKPNSPARPMRVLSDEDALSFARQWFIRLDKAETDWWERCGRKLDPDETNEALLERGYLQAALNDSPGVDPRHWDDGSSDVRAFLEESNLTLREDSPAYAQLCKLFREARMESLLRSTDRLQRQPFACYNPLFSETFGHSSVSPKPPGITIQELGEKFVEDQRKAKKAVKTLFAYGIHTRLMAEILGADTPINQVTRTDVERLCDLLETMPSNATKRYPGMSVQEAIKAASAKGDTSRLADNSRRNYFFNMFSVFQYAVETKLLEDNPFNDRLFKQRFTPTQNDGEPDDRAVPFTMTELQKLFSAPLYTGCKDDERGYVKPGPNVIRRGRFWVPLIALFHGLRLNEICQLYTEDVKYDEGELVMEVRTFLDDGPALDKALKNKASKRTVPIHPELLKMGFQEYVNGRQAEIGSHRLFPELRIAKKSGSYGDVFSKWFSRFVVHAIGQKPQATFHSFRHGWRDALREADVSEERVNKLGGWAHRGQHAKYGRAKLIQQLKGEISKVQFRGLDLSHLYTSPVHTVCTGPTRCRERFRQ